MIDIGRRDPVKAPYQLVASLLALSHLYLPLGQTVQVTLSEVYVPLEQNVHWALLCAPLPETLPASQSSQDV